MPTMPPNPAPEDRAPEETQQSGIMLILYAALTIGVLLLSSFLASRAATPLEANTTGSPRPATQSPTGPLESAPPITPADVALQADTHTPTPRPTFTPRPSATPTITPTPSATPTQTLVPSLTPAVPVSEDERYTLVNWTPELADQWIDLMEAYPETLSAFSRGEDDSGYYAAFDFAVLALREALLRFTTAPQADEWLWGLAYNLARTGDPGAGPAYASLITQALNAGQVLPADLYRWGNARHPAVIIETIPLQIPTGYLSNSLVKVSAGENGSAFFWLLERPDRFESYPLTSDFDFVHPTGVSHFVSDLTGDGSPEVAIFRTLVPESYQYILPRIFQLNEQPPVELHFEPFVAPEVGPDFENHWEPVEPGAAGGVLQFNDAIFPPCPITVQHLFDWNGRAFEFLEAQYMVDPTPELLSYCSLVVEHAASVWSVDTTVQIMETLLQSWPPETTVEGRPYAPDALDEWRYRLALYHALLEDLTGAQGYASSIVANPATPDSRWIAPAREFLAVYQTPRDVYRACLLSSLCKPRLAFEQLAATLTHADYELAPQVLSDAGVTIRTTGFFDFDLDGETERWIILRQQTGGELEFWILDQTDAGIEALPVGPVNADRPEVAHLEPLDDPPIVRVGQEHHFQLVKRGAVQEPFVVPATPEVVFSADVTEANLDQVQSALFAGGDPAQLQAELLRIEDESFFTCSYLLCPRFLYLLGLSSELSGDNHQAILAYLRLWREYLGHPFSTVARLKLAGPAIPPGPTITPTRTGTRIPSATPIRTATPTRTGTPPTPTPSRTPTQSGGGLSIAPTPTLTLDTYP